MAPKINLIFMAVFLINCNLGQGQQCSSGQIRCHSGSQCINLHEVCRNGKQCSDGSDEDSSICSFWTYDSSQCSSGNFYCSNYGSCYSVSDYCRQRCASKDSRICQMVKSGRLRVEREESGMTLTEEMVKLVQKSVNSTSQKSGEPVCPMFYTQVGSKCIAFFSPAKIPWAEARQFCLSIMGDLLTIEDLPSYDTLISYMRLSQLTTDYWIGGRYDLDYNAWTWVSHDNPMVLGSPYWGIRYSASCVPRSPPHTDPFTSPGEALPGAPCFHYLQAPAQRKQGWCAAMTYEHYYYFTDEECQENRSPLCVFNENLRWTPQEKNGNSTQ